MSAIHVVVAANALISWSTILVISAVGIGLAFFFVRDFAIPARRGNAVLDEANAKLEAIRAEVQDSKKPLSSLVEISAAFDDELLKRHWDEFADTLHLQYAETVSSTSTSEDDDDSGVSLAGLSSQTVRYRQTVPARDFFSYGALVETPLKTEVFKHLPGVYTSLGIIGTFIGVIAGLSDFNLTGSADSVAPLLTSVQHAFVISAIAIVAAIIVLIWEKLQVNWRVEKTAVLCDLVDALFQAGSEQDYLRDIVESSAISASQLEQLKQITGKLEQLDTTMREQTTGVFERVDQALAEPLSVLLPQLVGKIEETFGDQIIALQQATKDATVGINQALEQLEASTRRLETMATQAREAGSSLTENLQQTADVIAGVRDASAISSVTLDHAHETATKLAAAGDTLAESLASTEQALTAARREAGSTEELITGLTTSAQALQEFTGDLGTNMKNAQQVFSSAAAASLDQQSTAFHNDLKQAVGLIHTAITDLSESIESMGDALGRMRSDVDALTDRQAQVDLAPLPATQGD
jgi:hypothetical protein